MSINVLQRDRCRICQAPQPYGFLHLKDVPLPTGHYDPDSNEVPFRSDMGLYWCPRCGAVQTQHDLDWGDYYTDYSYTVSHSQFARDFMRHFACSLWRRFDLAEGCRIVEVGSSDGYQLKCFADLGATVLGYEPAEILAQTAGNQGIKTLTRLFDEKAIADFPPDMLPVDAVVCQYTFDHLPEPVEFLKTVQKILHPKKGVIVIEVHDFEKIVQRNEACLFTHEHATYLTKKSFQQVFEQAGFQMVATQLVEKQFQRGNSLIVAAAPLGSAIPQCPLPKSPALQMLEHKETYDQFACNVRTSHQCLAEHVHRSQENGKRLAGYGAAARGINTLIIAGLDRRQIGCVYDRNPRLHGLLMPVVDIPIAAPEQLLNDAQPPDEIIVFSYGYLNEIRDRLKPYLQQGGKIHSLLEYLKNEPSCIET